MKHRLFVISAASGAGKTTLKNLVIQGFPDICYSISATTRSPREGEIDGVHYFFKTKEEFKKMIAEEALVEWNEVHGNYYGTPKKFVEEKLADGKRVLFDLDVFGKVNFDKVYPEATGILILPPSIEELKKRLCERASDTEEVIQLRLANANKEMDFAHQFGKYEYTIINDDLEKAAQELREILKDPHLS
ncbi:MAG TPA: guanylate kinase [Fibrobacter sp.]|nr:guanylate kinase [Fibrobacter sp.]